MKNLLGEILYTNFSTNLEHTFFFFPIHHPPSTEKSQNSEERQHEYHW